jgi:hypothetical protein
MATLRTGGCLYGGIRYESSGEPVFALQCPLPRLSASKRQRLCRRGSGAGGRVPYHQGAPRRYIAKADRGNEIARVFCPDCGSPLTELQDR